MREPAMNERVARKYRPLAQTHLLLHGWTLPLIKRLLGEPDELAPNPYYPDGPQMRLYDQERVTEAEKTEDFIKNNRKRGSALRRRVVHRGPGIPPLYHFQKKK